MGIYIFKMLKGRKEEEKGRKERKKEKNKNPYPSEIL